MSDPRQSITLQYGLILVLITGIVSATFWVAMQFADIRTEFRKELFELNKKLDLHIATTTERKP